MLIELLKNFGYTPEKLGVRRSVEAHKETAKSEGKVFSLKCYSVKYLGT